MLTNVHHTKGVVTKINLIAHAYAFQILLDLNNLQATCFANLTITFANFTSVNTRPIPLGDQHHLSKC